MKLDITNIYAANTNTDFVAAALAAARTMPTGQALQILRKQEAALDAEGFVLQNISASGFAGGSHYLHADGRKVVIRGAMMLLVA